GIADEVVVCRARRGLYHRRPQDRAGAMPGALAVEETLRLPLPADDQAAILDAGEAPERRRDGARRILPGGAVRIQRGRIRGQRIRLGLAETGRPLLLRLVLQRRPFARERLDRVLVGVIRGEPDGPTDRIVFVLQRQRIRRPATFAKAAEAATAAAQEVGV